MAPGIADKKNNSLPMWGNEKTMNLNNLILTNILSSHYFKVNLYQLKTYHEVIDEIYYQVTHLEPWEKGSRKTSGQTGMCGGVRGVGAGGIVSTAFCILYKLFTLKLTRKQVVGLINHADSPFIRALGFMYIRYTQPPSDLWDWYEPYLSDPEELDVKAGTGQIMTIGEMLRHFLSKLEWFSTLFPRIPVPIQKDLEKKLSDWRSRPENKALLNSSECVEEKVPSNNEQWCETSSSLEQRETHDADTRRDEHAKDFDEELRKAQDRHSSSSKSHRHSSQYGDRSRSPRHTHSDRSHRDRDMERHRRPSRERGRSSERSHHRPRDTSYRDKEFNGKHSVDRHHIHGEKHRHSHSHSKKPEKHSHRYHID